MLARLLLVPRLPPRAPPKPEQVLCMTTTVALWALATCLVVIGTIGLALPAMPGAPLLFGGLVIAAWAEDFQYVGTAPLIFMGVLAALTYVVDIGAGAMGAKKFGASRLAMIGAGIGAIVGGIFLGIPGILLGPFCGALCGEIYNQRGFKEAGLSGLGATLGLLVGTLGKLIIAMIMVATFAVLRFS